MEKEKKKIQTLAINIFFLKAGSQEKDIQEEVKKTKAKTRS